MAEEKNRLLKRIHVPITRLVLGRYMFSLVSLSLFYSKSFCLYVQIITPDARNHGDSGRSTKMSFFLQALDVHHLIQELQLSKVVLLANSMGAKTAMTFALSYPASLDSLITVDISPWPKRQTLAEKHLPQIVAALRAMDLSLIKDRRDADKILMDVLPVSFE